MNIKPNVANLALLRTQSGSNSRGQSPQTNWRKLSGEGHGENAADIAGYGIVGGGAGAGIGHVSRTGADEPHDEKKQKDEEAVTGGGFIGGVLGVGVKLAKDAYDTILDKPNTGKYADGTSLSNRNADGTPKRS